METMQKYGTARDFRTIKTWLGAQWSECYDEFLSRIRCIHNEDMHPRETLAKMKRICKELKQKFEERKVFYHKIQETQTCINNARSTGKCDNATLKYLHRFDERIKRLKAISRKRPSLEEANSRLDDIRWKL